jgi:hypothetical protein
MAEYLWNFKDMLRHKIHDYKTYFWNYKRVAPFDFDDYSNDLHTTGILQFSEYRLNNLRKLCSEGGFSKRDTAFIDKTFLTRGPPSTAAAACIDAACK